MTLYDLAQRFVGEIREMPGGAQHPFIQWCLFLCGLGDNEADETPWCSAFLNGCCWLKRLPRSKSARARSWLNVGTPTQQKDARLGDVVIIKQQMNDPGAEVIATRGHVGLFAGWDGAFVLLLGGNQGNQVSIARFTPGLILGVRRIE